jgi:membrane-bound lytic murein transglycosylase A
LQRWADCRKAAGTVAAAALVTLLAACQSTPPRPAPPAPPPAPPQIKTSTLGRYAPASIDRVRELGDADVLGAWPAWLASCRAIGRREAWRSVCADSALVDPLDVQAIRGFLVQRFAAWQLLAETREESTAAGAEPRVLGLSERGRITGYYEPLLLGSRVRDARFTVPLHRPPEDLLTIDLASVYPELAGKRVRGRLVDEGPKGKRVVPYFARSELSQERLAGREIVWVDDAIEAFFLQIQGSGRVQLPDGGVIRVGYADTNGQPYRSVGRVLIERGELTFEQASMQGIQAWARANPARLDDLLNQNPSYVFFRELPVGDPNAGPVGALNVPLTPGYSVAIDPQFVPLGAPVLIATQHPSTAAPLQRLVLAQDTGGAIRGPIRFDFFWGFGKAAGEQAGRQRHDVQGWLLLPKGVQPELLLAPARP